MRSLIGRRHSPNAGGLDTIAVDGLHRLVFVSCDPLSSMEVLGR